MSSNAKTVPNPGRKRTAKGARTQPEPARKTALAPATPTCAPGVGKPPSAAAKTAETRVRRAVSAEERRRMIAEAAYFIAEREHFRADPAWCWLQAEREIDGKVVVK